MQAVSQIEHAVGAAMSRQLAAHQARTERKDALVEAAEAVLRIQFMAACISPLKTVPTPAFGEPVTRFIDVLSDQLGGKDSDDGWVELVAALRTSPAGLAFLRKQADRYATYHAEDDVAEAL